MDYEFRDLLPFARVVRVALVIWAVAATGYAASAVYGALSIEAFQAGAATLEDLARVDSISSVAAWTMIAINVVTTVLVSIWIYRANRNAHALSDEMEMTPGWNVGWFFVPIAFLWKPFEGISQSWRTSVSPTDSGTVTLPGWMRLWWGSWLVSIILNNIAFRLYLRAETLEDLQLIGWIETICLPFDLVAAYTLLLLVTRLSRIQRDAHDRAAAGLT